jgi:hypothetical protein
MKLYRYRDRVSANYDYESGRITNQHIVIICDEFEVIKETQCGVWIDVGRKRFVKSNTTKKFAHVNKDDAMTSFIKRKEKQISILANQLDKAKEAHKLAINGLSVSTLPMYWNFPES